MDYTQYFVEIALKDNTHRTVLTNEAPVPLCNFIHRIHNDFFYGSLPNDWIYNVILEAFEALGRDELDNCTIEADVYDNDLKTWYMNSYANQLCIDIGPYCEPEKMSDPLHLISCAQERAKQSVYEAVDTFLNDQKGE